MKERFMWAKMVGIGWVLGAFLLVLALGCEGPKGAAGINGVDGTPAVDKGSISGTVRDGSGTPIAGAAVETNPATSSATTDASGSFTISNVPIGVYTVTATKSGYVVYSLTGVGIAAGSETNVSLVLTAVSPSGPGTITGFVRNASGTGLVGATVSAQGQGASTTSVTNGAFTLSNVNPGFVYLSATAAGYLSGETRSGTYVPAGGAVSGVYITLSSRPTSATYVGGGVCAGCHGTIMADEQLSAHYRSITGDRSRMMNLTLWPAVGGTITPGVNAVDPATGAGSVPVYLCQNVAGVYGMKFSGASDCTVADGTYITVSGTYGGEGDGGINNVPNLGKFKQRFLAELSDVPFASSWTYDSQADKDRDWLILPVQITQSGDGAPKFGAYHNTDWTDHKRTFSRGCAGCHNTGLSITWETTSGNNYIKGYNYIDPNITCERCHGPGSEHAGGPSKLNIIIPRYLTADAERQVCGQCHAADSGKSKVPDGSFGYAYNSNNASFLGGGIYVPGVYNIADYIKGLGVPLASGGGFDAWPDNSHGKAHRQQYAELAQAVHTNNPYEKLACSSCHNVHTLIQGPKAFTEESGADTYVFNTPKFKNNVLCLGCHAGYGPYAGLTKADAAAIHVDAGGSVTKNGSPYVPSASQIGAAKNKIATSVGTHMQDEVSMGVAAYNPLDETAPVGRCQSCHMPKTGKSGGYLTGLDFSGATALIEGDEGSHVFDVVWPWESASLKKLSGGADTDIMPNSCGACHVGARLSGN